MSLLTPLILTANKVLSFTKLALTRSIYEERVVFLSAKLNLKLAFFPYNTERSSALHSANLSAPVFLTFPSASAVCLLVSAVYKGLLSPL